MKVSTVKIEHKDGYCLINESDFNPSKHQLYKASRQARSQGAVSGGSLQSLYAPHAELGSAGSPSQSLIDLNTASLSKLMTLETIGKVAAEKIIKARPFESLEDARSRLSEIKWEVIIKKVEVKP